MYQLTLTKSERDAIDWIGNRYSHGDDLFKLLLDCHDCEKDWSDLEGDVMFNIPENIAWEITQIRKDCEGRWDCFVDSFRNKMNGFCNSVV